MTLAETLCRDSARIGPRAVHVGAPDEIDLETIAWQIGRLHIEYGDLDTADGRLVAGPNRGSIRVRAGIAIVGRRRFVVATRSDIFAFTRCLLRSTHSHN